MDREPLDRKVLGTIEAYDMLRQGECVLAGVSGGADSVTLLDFLCALRRREEWRIRVCACHVHHGLRGEEADRDASFVVRLCERYGVDCRVFRLDIAAEARRTGRGIEEAGRAARYGCFEEAARAFGADRIATAHTLSDSLETALLNLARGTGLRGLCGVPPVRGKIIRPFAGVTRAEVEDYCARRGLAFVGDSTNEGDDYSRNLLRHRAVPALYAVNPAADRAYARLRETLGQAQDYLEGQARGLLAAAAVGDGYDAAALLRAHPAPRREALAQLLRQSGAQVSAGGVEALEEALTAGADACRCVSGARRWRLRGGTLTFEDTAGAKKAESHGSPVPVPMKGGTVAQFDGKIVLFLCETYEHYKENENIEKRLLKNVADYDKIGNNAVIRTRRPGDRFSAPGRGWTKTLKKLLNEAGVAAAERDRLLVCADDSGVFWMEGFGVDARAAVDRATRRVLVIRAENTSGGSTE